MTLGLNQCLISVVLGAVQIQKKTCSLPLRCLKITKANNRLGKVMHHPTNEKKVQLT